MDMHVNVNEPGGDVVTGHVGHRCGRARIQVWADGGDFVAGDGHIHHPIPVVGGVNHPALF